MHKNPKRIISGIISMAMTAVSAAVPTAASITPIHASAVQVLGESTFEDKALPWHVCSNEPARQQFSFEDGTFHIEILLPEGADKEKWDLQFRHRNLNFKKDHEYKVSFRVKSSRNGMELCSLIGNVASTEEYFELDGGTNDMHMGPDMEGQWPTSALKLTTEWQTIEGVFKPTKDLEACQWTFQYAKGTKYQGNAKQGDEVWFDDMSIECLTCDEDPESAVCGWTNSGDMFIKPKSDVRLNQMGYFPTADKKAAYVTSEEKEALDFKVVDKDGKAVYTGKTVPAGFDKMAGEYCQIIDFSAVKAVGTYKIVVDDDKKESMNISHEFRIGSDIYDGVLTNALNYYYQKRSGSDIEPDYITSGNKSQLAHKDMNEKDVAYVQDKWFKSYLPKAFESDIKKDIPLDVSGGWYDAEGNSKSVVSGGTAAWLLQNMYERSKKNGTDSKWTDGKTMNIPDSYKLSGGREVSCKGTPDILDEARYELEFMFRMIVDPEKDTIWGEKYADLVYSQVREFSPLPVGYVEYNYIGEDTASYKRAPRIISPPTYSATFNMIACAAQASRLWKGIDDEFSAECLDHAKKSWEAVMKYKDEFEKGLGNLNYDDQYTALSAIDPDSGNDDVRDEAYWAACELFATTGDEAYYDYLKEYDSRSSVGSDDQRLAFGVPNLAGLYGTGGVFTAFDRANKIGCGSLSLYLSDKTSDTDKAAIKKSLLCTADKFVNTENDVTNNAMGVPYEIVSWKDPYTIDYYYYRGYDYGSNSRLTDNAIVMAYAYDATGDSKYLNGALQAMDYIFGRNALGFSYVTGCGSYHVNYPTDTYWAYEIDNTFPKAPDGVLAGGPCSSLYDEYIRLLGINRETAPQKCYADTVESWSTNVHALDWQAGFAWDMAFFEDAVAKVSEVTTSATTTAGTATTTTTVTGSDIKKHNGDANCDGDVDMSDVVLIMQALANPNKYGTEGTAEHHLTEQGKLNGDMNGDGLTVGDAQAIQMKLLGLSNIDKSAIAGKIFAYEKEGAGGYCTLSFNENGRFLYSPGKLSSYMGGGDWKIDGDTVSLIGMVNKTIYLKITDDTLVYIAESSDEFPYMDIKDGEKFGIYRPEISSDKFQLNSRYSEYGLGNPKVELNLIASELPEFCYVENVRLYDEDDNFIGIMSPAMDADIWSYLVDCNVTEECSKTYYTLTKIRCGEKTYLDDVRSEITVNFKVAPAP